MGEVPQGQHDFSADALRYRCGACGKIHKGLPDISFSAPLDYYEIPEDERMRRAVLSREACVLDDHDFFLRTRLAIPILGQDMGFGWLVWCAIPEADFWTIWQTRHEAGATLDEPFDATLANKLPDFANTHGLDGVLTLAADGTLPRFIITDTDHPLGTQQRSGVSGALALGTAQSAGARLLIAS